ncbi:TfoX/Sxy family DNA transformation protein, partial [Neisseria sp. P0017.S004]|uniref:TfoX/Sxy family DNA transformation protein n=1 Tax=Neisseria sp. P0017.S004 TaxID=3436780 RepID=UPI003F7E7F51
MRNLGEKSRAWLAAVGIHNEEDLIAVGSVEAYKRAKSAFPKQVSLNLLYGMEAALLGLRLDELPPVG